jgi:hypothetical protein
MDYPFIHCWISIKELEIRPKLGCASETNHDEQSSPFDRAKLLIHVANRRCEERKGERQVNGTNEASASLRTWNCKRSSSASQLIRSK